ncbi:hypothetical protein R6Q59_035872, partial [Mikania micrantha]
MVHLSDELIVFEILTRVPARTVGRSKCVCKKWMVLLLTQQFVKLHCSRSSIASNQRALLVDDQTYFAHPINFQSGGYGRGTIVYFPFKNFKIYSHLDGLLCVCLDHTSELVLWNLVTGAYKLLSTHDRDGLFEYNADAIGLYVDAYDDYKVLHIKRRCCVFIVSVSSRKLESWINIPFISRPEFHNPYLSLSSGTFYERFKEINIPPVASAGMTFGDLVNIENELYMFVSMGIEFMWLELWILKDDHWIK